MLLVAQLPLLHLNLRLNCRSIIIFIRILFLLLCSLSLVSLYAAEDLFGNTIEDDSGEKIWTKAEVSALKKLAKSEYKKLMQASDYWSALQYEVWLRNTGAKVKIKSPLGRAYIGNPLYAFPHTIRQYYDHGDQIVVISDARLHTINVEGKPLKPSVNLPFAPRQGALTDDGKYTACMEVSRRGPVPGPHTYHWRIATVNLEQQEQDTDIDTDWRDFDYAVNTQLDSSSSMAHDGSAAALSVRGEPRKNDEIIIARRSGRPLFYKNMRDPKVIGRNGGWIIARHSISNKLQYRKGKKYIDVGPVATRHGHAAVLNLQHNKISIITPDGKWLDFPLTAQQKIHIWATDTWLVVHAGKVSVREKDTLDIMGTVVKKGATKNVVTSYAYLWTDIIAGTFDKPQKIIGTARKSRLHYDSMLVYQDNILSKYDLSGEKIQRTEFANFDTAIVHVDNYTNGIMVATDNRKLRHMLNFDGTTIWKGSAHAIRMCGPDSMLREIHIKNEKEDYYRTEIIRFLHNGDTHVTTVPLPKTTQRYRADSSVFGGEVRIIHKERSWVHIDQRSDTVIRDGHVADTETPLAYLPLPRWRRFDHGRFNSYEGRLIPKWRYTTPQFDDIFTPFDAMYTRLGLMVTDSNQKLHRFDRKLKRADTLLDKGIMWGEFDVQRKDLNTYIISQGAEGQYVAHIIDGKGRFRQPKPGITLDPQNPEGTWRVDRGQLHLPRWGKISWPEEKSGFRPWRMRSRDEASNLLLVTRSLIIDFEPSMASRFFPR